MDVLAIIPARGGSKGIPRKNLLPFAGKPLIAHAIDTARAAEAVTRVIVSTDDDEIADTARRHGAEAVMRPAALSGDHASSEAALMHVLDTLEQDGYRPEVVLLMQCTSPFTRAVDLDRLVAAIASGADSAFTVAPSHQFLWHRTPDGARGVNHDHRTRAMRQAREPEYVETGSAYAMRMPAFRVAGHRFFGHTELIEVPADTHFELDEPADVALAVARFAARTDAVPALPFLPEAIVFDFDGVMTDDRVHTDQEGTEAVVCSRRDGLGLEMLRHAGMRMMVISKEANRAVAARCAKLKLPVEHGIDDKLPVLDSWLARHAIRPADAFYVGNDVNDLACMAHVGCAAAPRDAHPAALAAARLVLDADGGNGAVRLLADMILAQRAR